MEDEKNEENRVRKAKGKVIRVHHTTKTEGKVEVYIHMFLTSALIRCACLLYTRGKEPQYPMYDRSCGPQGWSKNVCLCPLSNPDSQIVYLTA
jgi:hypothetical protein